MSNLQSSTNAPIAALDVGSSELSVRRFSLPDKAPKDETWLSPFGPLTTKAAKAASPSLRYDGTLENPVKIDLPWPGFRGWLTQLRNRFTLRSTLGSGESPVENFLLDYAKWVALSDVFVSSAEIQ